MLTQEGQLEVNMSVGAVWSSPLKGQIGNLSTELDSDLDKSVDQRTGTMPWLKWWFSNYPRPWENFRC